MLAQKVQDHLLADRRDLHQARLALGRVEQLVEATLAGTAEPVVSFGLAEGAMGVIAMQDDVADSGCVVADHPDVIEAVKAAAEGIISGAIVVPDPMAAG